MSRIVSRCAAQGPVALTKAGKELMLLAQPAWLTTQVEAEALLGKDGMIAVISISDRIVDHPIWQVFLSKAEPTRFVRRILCARSMWLHQVVIKEN